MQVKMLRRVQRSRIMHLLSSGRLSYFCFLWPSAAVGALRQRQMPGDAHPGGWHTQTRPPLRRFLSHYLIQDRYGRPGKGNDKGSVEGLVGWARRNFMLPLPRFASWDDFNAWLEEQCRKRQADTPAGACRDDRTAAPAGSAGDVRATVGPL